MNPKNLARTIIAAGAISMGVPDAAALTWLGYINSGNDSPLDVQGGLGSLGLPTDIALFGKSDEGAPLSGFTPSLESFGGTLSGSISYAGPADILYLTFKVGQAGPAKDSRTEGFHLYAWDGGGEFNLLTDPNPDFVKQGNTISHISVWTGNTPVPELGATALLLGLGFAGIIAVRKLS